MKEITIKSQSAITKKKSKELQKRILDLFYSAKKPSYEIDEIRVLFNVSSEEVADSLYHLVKNEALDFSSLDHKPQRFYLSTNFLMSELLGCIEDHKRFTELLVLTAEEKNEKDIQKQQLVKAMVIFNSELKDIVNQKISSYFSNY